MVVEEYSKRHYQSTNIRIFWHNCLHMVNLERDEISNEIIPIRVVGEWQLSSKGNVIISQKKQLSIIEEKIAKMFNAPKEVKRELDEMNSSLWLLMDGKKTQFEIILEMEKKYTERIVPANERIIKSIKKFVDLGLVRIVKMDDKQNRNLQRIE